jgi:SAM-dependent methyltransferase
MRGAQGARRIRTLINTALPGWCHLLARKVFLAIRSFGSRLECPCCGGRFWEFLPFGVTPRPNALCPGCGSLERHRLLWLFLRDRTNFFTARLRVLDVAPTRFFSERCTRLQNLDYVSADLSSPLAHLHMDITDIPLPDDSFDCIICCHVLEHIPDDRKAMRELYRILRPGGWAIIQSPIDASRDKTFEDPGVVSPEDRHRLFGQSDHVRVYGRDYQERLEEAGFVVRMESYMRDLGSRQTRKYGLGAEEEICACSKPG